MKDSEPSRRVNRPDDPTAEMVLPEGSLVGGYRVSFLAAGGMSTVYQGEKGGRSTFSKRFPRTNPVAFWP